MNWDVVVVGAGAAGLLAACRASEAGRRTLLLEKNKKPGVKILMSGGARCNLTHATDRQGIVAAYGKPGRFLHSALAGLGPAELVELIEAEGVPTKREATGKIFPVSNRAADVLNALLRRLERSDACLALGEPLLDWAFADAGCTLRTGVREIQANEVILTTGGQSYPRCGTTGDGYRLCRQLGLEIVPTRPALAPVTLADEWAKQLSGITLPDVRLQVVTDGPKPLVLEERRSSFLFTHFGCSGPAPMDVSRAIAGAADPNTLRLRCDWAPERSLEELRQDLLSADGKRTTLSWLCETLPQRLAEALLVLAGTATDQRLATLGKVRSQKLVELLKGTPLRPTGTLGFAKAEVTAGGVALHEVDSRTMRCKKVPRLLIAGETLDLDGPIGGFNFQAAFSTGWLAGELKR